MSRFDYVKYDDIAIKQQKAFKEHFQLTEELVEGFADGREKSLILTKLEEAYMWIGKAIRDEQIKRNPDTQLEEGRKHS